MNTLIERIADYNNLYWAWHKAKNIYRPGDIWFNELEVAQFEANLAQELLVIHEQIVAGNYALTPISPIAYPKSANDEGPRTRQTFWVSVRDQVAWLAVVNIIGSYVDAAMPHWSYGNRLYLTVFHDETAVDQSRRQFGYYRNTTRNLFRKWKQSWPLYRLHINMTARLMAKGEREARKNLEEQEQQVLDDNKKLHDAHPMQSDYLLPGHWGNQKSEKLYWAGLDLEKFYPNISQEAIKINLRSHLPQDVVTDSLFQLIDSLLDFKIDFTGWNDLQLSEITLSRDEEYPHLPTGLFVAGFLANSALLAIDLKVAEDLKDNMEVAHFRFVDDHVVLARSFEALTKWITDYKELLAHADIGATLNTSKTIPKPLGEYFAAIEKGEDANGLLRSEAIKATSLDPDFPNPLMTQTLAKVSRIARTEFNLLTPDEEKSLIADVEHLLITDFPDHELRKDTRVSFAARMLSSMVPRMMVDNSKVYQHQKEISIKKVVLADYKKSFGSYKGEKRLAVEESIKACEESLKLCTAQLKTENQKLHAEEKHLSERTIKLLLKAVFDNHDKVRLWARLLEFYQKSGIGKPHEAAQTIKKLLDNKSTNKLSATFINALVLQVLSALMLDTVKIIDNPHFSYKRRKRAENFLKNVLDDNLLAYFQKQTGKKAMPYEQLSHQLFRFSFGTVIYLFHTKLFRANSRKAIELNRKYQLIDWNNPSDFFAATSFDAGIWCWWLLDNLPTPALGQAPLLWPEITACLDTAKPSDLNLLLRYPAHIPATLLAQMNQLNQPALAKNEGVLYDITKKLNEGPPTYEFLNVVTRKSQTLKEFRTVDQWIDWTAREQWALVKNDHYAMRFDPRLGEWAALIIIHQIAQRIDEKMTPEIQEANELFEYYRLVHPNNFKLPAKWIEAPPNPITWESVEQMFKEDSVKFRSAKNWIMDNRFVPLFGMNEQKQFQAVLNALGSLLISLLAKNTTLPDKWNPLGQQLAWMGLARTKLKDVAVSTYTRDIIDGCFSNRNIETRLFKRWKINESFSFDFAKDDKLDPPAFIDIKDFLRYVDFAIRKLKIQQLSVSMHQPRQLTPISLVQLNDEKYQQLLEESPLENEGGNQ